MRYRAYGLTLESELVFPELEPSDDASVQIDIALGEGSPPPPRETIAYAGMADSAHAAFTCARCDGGYLQTIVGAWRFFVSGDGTRIVAYPPLPAPETLRHLLLDNILPHALNLAGHDSLHATAVLTPRGVVAFMGPSGAGKSTLAAHFLSRGFELVCDDCLVLSLEGEKIIATPSYPGLRLLPDGVAWIGLDERATTAVAEYGTKRRILGEASAAMRGGALAAIYVLPSAPSNGEAASVMLEVLSKRDAFAELLRSSFRVDVDDRPMVKRQFELFAAIVEHVPISRLVVPRSLAEVDAALVAIRADLDF